MPKSIIRRVDRHARQDKAASRMTFADRNNRPYDDVSNEEYDEKPEGLLEPESSPFPDIPAEMPGVDLAEHMEEIPAVTQPDDQAETMQQARLAAANAGLDGGIPLEAGPHLIEAEEDEIDEGGSITSMGDVTPAESEGIIDVDAEAAEPEDQEAELNNGAEVLETEPDEESILSDHEGDIVGNETGGLLDQGEGKQDPEPEPNVWPDGEGPRRSKRKRKVLSKLDGFEHNIFATYN